MKFKPQVYKSLLDPKSEELLDHVYQDRMEYLGLMSSAMVHQLQIPLVIMRGKIESYLRYPQRSPQQTLIEISEETQYLLKLLESMVFVAPRSKEIQFEMIDLRNLLEKLLIIFQGTCTERSISLNLEIPEGLKVHTEPNRMRNILIALITNAVDSFLTVPAGQVRNILIHTRSDSRGIHLIISDTGCGMNQDVQKKLLTQAFFSTKQQQASSGLGLALAKKIASDLKVDIGFLSEEGRGTSFSLTFPRNLYSLESNSDSSSDSDVKL